ncbi:carbamoyl-phosphate synthase large subunit [Candidatus Vidania fulgoroideorum]
MIGKALLIGSGAIIIGQACEFDYAGVQACEGLMEEGVSVIVLNSNPSSLMTDANLCNKKYIEPINIESVTRILKEERIRYLIPCFGGQTALNLVINLEKQGILKRYRIKTLGASISAITNAESRRRFRRIMVDHNVPIGLSRAVNSIRYCALIKKYIEKKSKQSHVIIRPSYTLGGLGGAVCRDNKDFYRVSKMGLKYSMNNEVLIEESLYGWREFEMEILIDRKDNFIVISTIENIDPVGVHTGDSITLSPCLTLTDKEIQRMRDMAKRVIYLLGIRSVGCNIQFAICRKGGNMKVIEVNPRVSRSSALASKITGYPIAKITSKLILGYLLGDIYNEITNSVITACFEPVLDYVAIKVPMFCNEKFHCSSEYNLDIQMRSIGETLSIAGTFGETLMKSLRNNRSAISFDKQIGEKSRPSKYTVGQRSLIYYIYHLIMLGKKPSAIEKATNIDAIYIKQVRDIYRVDNEIYSNDQDRYIYSHNIEIIKKCGHSDRCLSSIMKIDFSIIRKSFSIIPGVHYIDSSANEFCSSDIYTYLTYHSKTSHKKGECVLLIGSGANRIGQGLEFDYCCTHALKELKRIGLRAAIINCNPETISTDYKVSDQLYMEPLSYEDIYNVLCHERVIGAITQLGGQTSLSFCEFLYSNNVPILGTHSYIINLTEDRGRLKNFLIRRFLIQPRNIVIHNRCLAMGTVRYPAMVRPSYVLGGSYMRKVGNINELKRTVRLIPNQLFPILVDEFLANAYELDIDCVAVGKDICIPDIMQYIEKAGIHSGDSAGFFPSLLSKDNKINIFNIVRILVSRLRICGFINVQFALYKNKIYVLEINPRASRTISVINKYFHINMISLFIFAIVFGKIRGQIGIAKEGEYFAIKEAVFSSYKYSGFDPLLGPEMRSTGEILSIERKFSKAFEKSQIIADDNIKSSRAYLSVSKNVRYLFLISFLRKRVYVDNKTYLLNASYDLLSILRKRKVGIVLLMKNDKKCSGIRRVLNAIRVYMISTGEAIYCYIYSLFFLYPCHMASYDAISSLQKTKRN